MKIPNCSQIHLLKLKPCFCPAFSGRASWAEAGFQFVWMDSPSESKIGDSVTGPNSR